MQIGRARCVCAVALILAFLVAPLLAATPPEIIRDPAKLPIQATNNSESGGLHSMLIPMIEGETWYQDAWSKALPGAKHAEGIAALDRHIEGLRARMATELNELTPLEYRRLLVDLDRAQRDYADRVWTAKAMALLEE